MERNVMVILLVLVAAAIPSGSAHMDCTGSPAPHHYGPGGAMGPPRERSVVTAYGIGLATDACGTADGDFENGVVSGFFGAGPWADEPVCQYGLLTHPTGVISVTDDTSPGIGFVTAADDQAGPTVHEVNGERFCETDGMIFPCPGDGICGAAEDIDDCISELYVAPEAGRACGVGGDGGFWVILVAVGSQAPTTGTIAAS